MIVPKNKSVTFENEQRDLPLRGFCSSPETFLFLMNAMKIYVIFAALVLCWGLSSRAAEARDFYVDAQKGSKTGDGSSARPWRSLQEVLDTGLVQTQDWDKLPYHIGAKLVPKNPKGPIKPGDRILLRSGFYGALLITNHYNLKMVTIAAAPGQIPRFSSIHIRSSSNWTLSGLHISPSFAPTYTKKTGIYLESHGYRGPNEKLVVERCVIFSVPDITKWSATDWNNKAINGIDVRGGQHITLRRNQLKNINFGISVSATHALVEHNTIENFAGDGMRGLGDDSVFQYNLVKNCYKVNQNHDDGFQSWSVGANGKVGTGVVKNVTLRGNTIINYEDPKQPFRCTLQGIGMFDGMFDGWVIENNVIMVDHWHGITLLGVKNSRVINNTVIDLNNTKPGPPWISMNKHKNGTQPSGCIVRNNLVTALSNAKTGVTADHNILLKMSELAKYFVDVTKHDLRLKAGSPAIDKGVATLAPKIDILGISRPQGAGFDVGAYEWTQAPPLPPEPPQPSEPIDQPKEPQAPPQDAGPMPHPEPPTTREQPTSQEPTRPQLELTLHEPVHAPDDAGQTTTEHSYRYDTQNHDLLTDTSPAGCGCQQAPQPTAWWLLGLLLFAALGLRRARN